MVQISEEQVRQLGAGDKARARVLISGHVHEVGFRWFLHKKAQEIGATGFIRNLEDGRLEGVFEGTKNQVEEMISYARSGPESAHVANLQIFWETPPEGKWDELEITY